MKLNIFTIIEENEVEDIVFTEENEDEDNDYWRKLSWRYCNNY